MGRGDKRNKCLMDDLQILQTKAVKVMLGLSRKDSFTDALKTLRLSNLYSRREQHCYILVYKYVNGLMEVELEIVRNSAIFIILLVGGITHICFAFHAVRVWNNLDDGINNIVNFKTVKRKLFSCQKQF